MGLNLKSFLGGNVYEEEKDERLDYRMVVVGAYPHDFLHVQSTRAELPWPGCAPGIYPIRSQPDNKRSNLKDLSLKTLALSASLKGMDPHKEPLWEVKEFELPQKPVKVPSKKLLWLLDRAKK